MDELKVCSRCKQSKSINQYGIYKFNGSDYRRSTCIQCRREQEKERRLSNPEKKKELDKKYYENNKEKVIQRQKDNKDKINEKRRERRKIRYTEDVLFRVTQNLRSRISIELKNIKNIPSKELLGTTGQIIMEWIEHQFDDNMTWDNYAVYWHIDHVVPVSYFDLSIIDMQGICFNWSNMRPLEKIENMKKCDNIIEEDIVGHANKFLQFIQEKGYQTSSENNWWRRLALRYGQNFEDREDFQDLLKWAIRIEEASTSTADITDALASLSVAE